MRRLSFVPFSADAARLVTSWASTAEEVAAWCSRSETTVPPEVVVGWSQKSDVEAYLLLDAGQPVAYGELWIDDDEEEVEIAHVIVDPRRRNQGFGKALTAQLVEAAHHIHGALFLRLAQGNAAAEACYTAAGFVRASAEQGWSGTRTSLGLTSG